MTKARDYGTTKAVVNEILHGVGHKRATMLLGVGISSIYSYADPDSPAHASFDHIRRLTAATGHTTAAEDLASLAGGVFTPVTPDTATAIELASKSANKHGQMIADFIVAAADGVITPDEAKGLLEDADTVLRVVVSLRQKLQSICAGA